MKYGILRETDNFPITYLKSGQHGHVKLVSPVLSCKFIIIYYYIYILGLFNRVFTNSDHL